MLENIFEIRRRDLSIESNKAERKERKLKKKKKKTIKLNRNCFYLGSKNL